LPDTSKFITDLSNLKSTINEIIDYVKIDDDENKKLKFEMIDLYKKMRDYSKVDIKINLNDFANWLCGDDLREIDGMGSEIVVNRFLDEQTENK